MCIKVGWPSGLRRYPTNSSILGLQVRILSKFCFLFNYFTFCQTLRANFWFQRFLAIEGPFLYKSRGFGPPLHPVITHVPLRALCESWPWKSCFKLGKWLEIGSGIQILNFPSKFRAFKAIESSYHWERYLYMNKSFLWSQKITKMKNNL